MTEPGDKAGDPAATPERRGNPLALLPKVDVLLGSSAFAALQERFGRHLVTEGIRADLAEARRWLGAGPELVDEEVARHLTAEACAERVGAALERLTRTGYPRALNATGVVLHTGLGRAPLAEEARRALADVSRSYGVLEVDAETGERGQRDAAISRLLAELTGAEAATIVNNNAGATLIALAALAAEQPVIVSRGQLVEIGGSYRIPDVMALSGARMVEVGTTNRTHLDDYARALDAHPDAAVILRVHTSNFRVIGFTKEVPLPDLLGLARERGVVVMDDLGSGCLLDLSATGLPGEPVVQDSVRQGAGVVTFSGDKLLGGPQAGLIVGQAELVRRIRKHPLYRALRPDKLTLAALDATLQLYRDPERAWAAVPVLRMLAATLDELKERAQALASAINERTERVRARVEAGTSRVGGGSYAIEELGTRVVALEVVGGSPEALAAALRTGQPAVFVRIQHDRVIIDPRTLLGPEEDAEVLKAILDALAQLG